MSEVGARAGGDPRWRPRARDLMLAALFVFGWLVPVGISAWRGAPPANWPRHARDLYAVSCLFGEASERISVFYVQVRREGERGWHYVDEGAYFELEPFGHRTRFDRFMARFGYQERAGATARRELATWLAAREDEREGARGRVVAVRFLWTDRHIDPEHPPTGRWRKLAPSELGAQPMRQLGEVVVIAAEGGKP
ncbi:hypothetical protein G6O69_05895 [Pseudenhygromyxa sp. WMMC2535]|uniref:hypothetical protein n=1 Tax=Pseudenhygromyxa sp. WMMC2535 TaxID=2712867 RepID=UPI001555A444|nr:hypothetical protein [Pseudenhygromyxa sp. WMMC2535]NVB37355.1 hypothetical protein [Pseudenhygromyxa sp. WMMC2535]